MNTTRAPHSGFRNFAAVLAGFFSVAVLSLLTDVVLHAAGFFPPWGQPVSDFPLLVATSYRTAYTVLGGYITARLASDRPMRFVLILGLIGLFFAALGAAATWNRGPAFGPRWYPLALVAVALPATWLGGRLARSPGSTDESRKAYTGQ